MKQITYDYWQCKNNPKCLYRWPCNTVINTVGGEFFSDHHNVWIGNCHAEDLNVWKKLSDGEAMLMFPKAFMEDNEINIFIKQRSDDWHASFDKQGRFWDCGKTRQEAIGNLVITWGKKFGINLN